MDNQAESFEDGDPDDHGISEQASLDAKDDSNDRPTVHTNGHPNGDTNGMKPSNGTEERGGGEENGGGNPYLQAILPDGGEYEDAGVAENQESTKPSDGNMSVGVGAVKKKKKTKTKSKSKRGLVTSFRTNDGRNLL